MELQADKFAAYFLMPQKLVKQYFADLFQTSTFIVAEESIFKFHGVGTVGEFKSKYRTKGQVARLLASSTFYAGRSFESLSEKFKVSESAMAIRIEELDLIDLSEDEYQVAGV